MAYTMSSGCRPASAWLRQRRQDRHRRVRPHEHLAEVGVGGEAHLGCRPRSRPPRSGSAGRPPVHSPPSRASVVVHVVGLDVEDELLAAQLLERGGRVAGGLLGHVEGRRRATRRGCSTPPSSRRPARTAWPPRRSRRSGTGGARCRGGGRSRRPAGRCGGSSRAPPALCGCGWNSPLETGPNLIGSPPAPVRSVCPRSPMGVVKHPSPAAAGRTNNGVHELGSPAGSAARLARQTAGDHSRAINAIASFSRSTNGSPETSTTAWLIVPPVKAYGDVPG